MVYTYMHLYPMKSGGDFVSVRFLGLDYIVIFLDSFGLMFSWRFWLPSGLQLLMQLRWQSSHQDVLLILPFVFVFFMTHPVRASHLSVLDLCLLERRNDAIQEPWVSILRQEWVLLISIENKKGEPVYDTQTHASCFRLGFFVPVPLSCACFIFR